MQKRGYHDFSFKIFCLTVPKKFVVEHFDESEIFGYQKVWGGGYHVSLSKNFCLTVPIKFEEPFCVSKEFWYRKFSNKGGGSFTVLSKYFLSHRTEKTSPGNHSVFQKASGWEKYFMDKRGGGGGRSITIFRRKVFV